jgi:DNA-directed RNA polymerase specialized sigma24 family protein
MEYRVSQNSLEPSFLFRLYQLEPPRTSAAGRSTHSELSMYPLWHNDLPTHRPRLITRAEQRHRAEGFSPRKDLVPEVLADDTLALAKQRFGGDAAPRLSGLARWLDTRLEDLITERWSGAVQDYTTVMTARARVGLLQFPRLASRVSPEDVVNDAWCKIQQYPFRGTTESHYYAWLLRLTATAVIDAARRHLSGRRAPSAEARPSTFDDPNNPFDRAVRVLYQSTPSAKLRREEFLVTLLAAVERMPMFDRSVALRTLNGEAINEIASALECPGQRVQGALTRILRQVRILLNDHPGAQ